MVETVLAPPDPKDLREYYRDEYKVVQERISDEYKRFNETFTITVSAVGAIFLAAFTATTSEKFTVSDEFIRLLTVSAFVIAALGMIKALGHMRRIRIHDHYLAEHLEKVLAGETKPTFTRYWFDYGPVGRLLGDPHLITWAKKRTLGELIAAGRNHGLLVVSRWSLWIVLVGGTMFIANYCWWNSGLVSHAGFVRPLSSAETKK